MAAELEHCNTTCLLCGAPALLLFRGCDCSNESCPEVQGLPSKFFPGDTVSWTRGGNRHFGVVKAENRKGVYVVYETILGGRVRHSLEAEVLERV